jgi:hypothetical protein
MATYRLGGTAAAPDPCAGAVCQAAAGPFAGCAGPWVPIPDEITEHPLSAADADPSPDAVAMRGPV